jgi:hypothetical protein
MIYQLFCEPIVPQVEPQSLFDSLISAYKKLREVEND